MIIGFWGNVHGQAGISSNMALIALLSDYVGSQTIMIQTGFCINDIDAMFSDSQDNRDKEFGMNTIIKCIKSGRYSCDMVKNCSVELYKDKLYYLPGPEGINQRLYEEDLYKCIERLIEISEKEFGTVLLDLGSGEKGLELYARNLIDTLVVNLSQNIRTFEDYESRFLGRIKKAFYIIGSYERNAVLTYQNLRRKYRFIKRKQTGIVRYSIAFKNAVGTGMLHEFVRRNLECGQEDEIYPFFAEARYTVEKLKGYISENTEDNCLKTIPSEERERRDDMECCDNRNMSERSGYSNHLSV